MTAEQIIEFAEGLGRIAASGGGAKALAAHLAETTGTGVLVEDAEWRHVATAGATALPPSARDLFDAKSFDDRTLRPHRNGRSGRTISIVAGPTHLGWLSLFPATADDTAKLETLEGVARLAASAMAVELARDQAGGRGRRRTFWERLIARAYHDPNAARDDAAARGIAIASHYVAIALELDVTDETRAPEEMAELRTVASEALRSADADLGLLDRGPMLVALVPVQREVDADNARTAATLLPKTAARRKLAVRFTGGVGTAEPLLGVYRSLERAESALAITRRLFGTGRVGVYDDLGAYPLLLSGAEADTLRDFAADVLAPLRAYDEKHQTELERTLRLYFSTGENVKTAAGELNVHRHTVFYRLRQIGEITRRSLESPHDQLTLRLAIAIDALHNE